MMKRAAIGLVAAIVTFFVLLYWRQFFWQHAVLMGVAVGALVYITLDTIVRLRHLYRGGS